MNKLRSAQACSLTPYDIPIHIPNCFVMMPLCWSTCISDGNALFRHLSHPHLITLTLTLLTVSLIQGINACDSNHSFYSFVNTVWLGFWVFWCSGVKFDTFGKIVRKYNTPIEQEMKKKYYHNVICALESLSHILILFLWGLSFSDAIFTSSWPALSTLLPSLSPSLSFTPTSQTFTWITKNFGL